MATQRLRKSRGYSKYKPYSHATFKTKRQATNFRKKVRKAGNSTHIYRKANGTWKIYIYH